MTSTREFPKTIDGHEDFLTDMRGRDKQRPALANPRPARDLLVENKEGHIDLPRLRRGGIGAAFASVYLTDAWVTEIYLPNADAVTPSQAELYRDLGLNEREIAIIARATPKRHYYFTSPRGSRPTGWPASVVRTWPWNPRVSTGNRSGTCWRAASIWCLPTRCTSVTSLDERAM